MLHYRLAFKVDFNNPAHLASNRAGMLFQGNSKITEIAPAACGLAFSTV
jgi:hypothetical protein